MQNHVRSLQFRGRVSGGGNLLRGSKRKVTEKSSSGLGGARRQQQQRASITCMGNQLRQARVSKQLEREIGRMLISDKVVEKALRPSIQGGEASDCMATVTDVWISGDLQVAKVQISLYSTTGEDMSSRFEQLEHLSGYIRKQVGRAMKLKFTPELRFYYNEDIKLMYDALEVLRLREESDARDGLVPQDPEQGIKQDSLEVPSAPDADDSDFEWEEESEEESQARLPKFLRDVEVPDVSLAFADLFDESPEPRQKFGRRKKPGALSGSKIMRDVSDTNKN